MNGMQAPLACLLVAVGVSACADLNRGEPAVLAAPATADRDQAGRYVADEIARYALNVAPGSRGSVTFADGRTISVRVGVDYVSATNEQCRRVILSDSSGQSQISAVCLVDGVWTTTIRLARE